MSSYFIESFKIDKLWGYRNIDLTFNKDVNVLIGPNGSGKTTILNLLHSILSGDLRSVLNFDFEQAKIGLKSFKGNSVSNIKVNIGDESLKLKVGQKEHEFHIDTFSHRRHTQLSLFHFHEKEDVIRNMLSEEIYGEPTVLVPLVWLPVSRRLPVTEDDEERHTRREPLESVDLRLGQLLDRLSDYHSRLNAQLSKRHREFERQVLSVILYNKDHDQLDSIFDSLPSSLPTEAERGQLLGAFEAAGLLDEPMQSRIDDHFAAAEKAVERIHEGKNTHVELEDVLVVPLIRRTQSMVEYARKLEKDREKIFAPLRRYEKTVNSFLGSYGETVNSFMNGTFVEVDENGNLKIDSPSSSDLNWHYLSSGEKQILILLTEALLKVDEPVVYIADEPELSLHVTWQEKLLESLVTLGGQKQVIVATHSPDIVGEFHDKVIDLGEGS